MKMDKLAEAKSIHWVSSWNFAWGFGHEKANRKMGAALQTIDQKRQSSWFKGFFEPF